MILRVGRRPASQDLYLTFAPRPPAEDHQDMYAGQVISALQNSATEIEGAHLRDLLGDAERCEAMTCECEGLFMDYSRQRVDKNTMDLLFKLASCTGVEEKRAAMLSGQKINRTEGRAVMHAALRAPRDQVGLHMMAARARAYFFTRLPPCACR